MLVGLEHLVDAPAGDLEPFGGLAVSRDQDATLIQERQHRGAVGNGRKRRGAGRAGGGRLGADPWGLMKRLRPPARQEVIETGAVRIEEERHGSQAFNFSRRTSTVSDLSSRLFVRASVPRGGSRRAQFLLAELPSPKTAAVPLC